MPLAKEEVQLIGGFTHRGDRVVPMSEALKDGDQVVVTAGPLLGHEGLIKTINRRKSTAYLELDLCGRRVTTRVGLAVLSAEQRLMRNLKKRLPSCGRLLKGAKGIPGPGITGSTGNGRTYFEHRIQECKAKGEAKRI